MFQKSIKKGWLYHPIFPSDWQSCSLYSMATWANGIAFKNIDFSKTGRPVIKIAEIKNGISHQTKYTEQMFDQSVKVQYNDLLFTWSGQPETSIDAYQWRGPEGWLNQHVYKVTTINNVNNVFFYYLLKYLKPHFIKIAKNKQTTGLGHVTKQDLSNMVVACPSLNEQLSIVHVLGTLDDKIELNRRKNKTLEAMAKALFKSWFVDFDPVRAKSEGRETGLPRDIANLFPDRLVDSEMGKIPEGWMQGQLSDISKSLLRHIKPSEVSDSTPYIGLEHMPRGSIAITEWATSKKVFSNKSCFNRGDILFGKLRPYFHKVGFAPIDGICSTDIVVVKSNISHWSSYILSCLSSLDFVNYTNLSSTGTRMPRTNWKTMKQYKICIPSNDVVLAFHTNVHFFLDGINANIHESRILHKIRDLLLPQLTSGKIKINVAENKHKLS